MGDSISDHSLFLALLGGALAVWFIMLNRASRARLVRQVLMWTGIFGGLIVAAGLWGDIRQPALPAQSVFAEQHKVELPRARDGHYYLTAEVNGVPVTFVIDTGATNIVLSKNDAAAIGLDPETLDYLGRATTANGEVRTAPVRLDELAVGPIVDHGLRAFVNEGALDRSLLGMDYLQRFSSLEITGGKMILSR